VLAPILSVNARRHVRGIKKNPEDWKIGLVWGATHIGDLLYVTPSLRALSERFPRCKWYCVADRYAAEILKGNPYLAGVVTPRDGAVPTTACIEAVIGDSVPDGALVMLRHSYWPILSAAVQSGIPARVGYADKGFSAWVTHAVRGDGKAHPNAAYYCEIIRQFCGISSSWALKPQVFLNQMDETEAERFLAQRRLGTKSSFAVVFATAKTLRANWSVEKYGAFVRCLKERIGVDVLLCGAAGDKDILESVRAFSNVDPQVAAGNLTLRQLAAVLRRARFSFGPDSGPRHIANSMGIPTFYLPNLMESEVEMGKYCDTEWPILTGHEFLTHNEAKNIVDEVNLDAIVDLVLTKVPQGVRNST